VIVFEGPHGYISPSWYQRTPAAPTYNYLTVQVRGSVEVLSDPKQALAVVMATASVRTRARAAMEPRPVA
jgi:transcriptional regulator